VSVRDRAAVAAGALTVVALVACYMPARLVATGSTVTVSYDYAAGKWVPLPDAAARCWSS